MRNGFQDSGFFEQRLWGNFGPEMEASQRNGSGAKQNVLSIKVSQDSGFSLEATISKRLIAKKQLSQPNSSTFSLVRGNLVSEQQALSSLT